MKNSILIPKYYYWLAEKALSKSNPDKLDIKRINAFINQLSKRNIYTETTWHPIARNTNKVIGKTESGMDITKKIDGFITKFFPTNKYKQYLTFLETENVIEIYHRYSVNQQVSKQARLKPIPKNDQYNGELLELIEVEAHKKYYDFILETSEIDSTDKDVVAIKNILTDRNISVDIDSAYKFILDGVGMKAITVDQGHTYLMMLNDIKQGKIYVKRGINNNRLYHSFAGLKRELRQFISYKGKPFVHQLDAINSQPLLLGKILYSILPDNKDVMKFYNLVNDGLIYEFFAERVYPELSKSDGRKAIKKFFLSFFYTNDNASLESNRKQYFQTQSKVYKAIKKIFVYEFKEVWNIITEIKKDNHNKLAILLAQIESEIFTRKMDKVFSNGCISVHDAVYFTDLREKVNISRRIQYNEIPVEKVNKILNDLNIQYIVNHSINIITNLKYEVSTYDRFNV